MMSSTNTSEHDNVNQPTDMGEASHIGRLARMSTLDTEVDGSNPGNSMLCP